MSLISSEDPFPEIVSYQEIITSIVKRFNRLAGMPAALAVARKVPALQIDDQGNVLNYNTNDPLGTITALIDQFEIVYGEIAHTLARQAAEPLLADAGEAILKEIGWSDSNTPTRILLVDDHLLFREGMVSLLNAESDMEIVGQTGTVKEAVELACKLSPDLVIMELSLPDGSGVEAIRLIHSKSPAIKNVVLTVYQDEEHLFEAIRSGAIGYLTKNVHASELIETLRGVMKGQAGITGITAQRILDEFARISHPDESATLTSREVQVLRELANGSSNQEIAKRLVISENTVKNHVRNVLVKLHLHSRRDAADYARRHGLTFLIISTTYLLAHWLSDLS